MRSILRAAPIAALALSACSDSPSSPAESGLVLVAGAALADTVDAELGEALEVRVRDEAGQPVAGATVVFEGIVEPRHVGSQAVPVATALVAEAGSDYGPVASVQTDGIGNAAVRVKLGSVAVEGGVVVAVPSLGLRDTARYTVRPGAGIDFVISPSDTAVYIGGTAMLSAGWIDRHGNVRDEPVSFATESAAVQLDGGTATPSGFGLVQVVASSGTASATARISVVPRGTIAAFSDAEGTRGIAVFDLDGSSRRQATNAGLAGEQVPYWSPAGDRIVFHSGASIAHLYTAAIGATAQPLPGASAGPLEAEKWAQFSRDGEWVYYSGLQNGFTWSIWRVRADGSGGAERIGPFGVNTQTDASPSPSPSGDRVVFWTNRYGGQKLAVLDVTTGEFQPIGPDGSTARWSPVSDRIAFIDGDALRIVDADGGNPRTLADSGFEEWVDWSPDGEWLVAAGESELWVIRVSDGLMLPIPHAAGMTFPSWRPTSGG